MDTRGFMMTQWSPVLFLAWLGCDRAASITVGDATTSDAPLSDASVGCAVVSDLGLLSLMGTSTSPGDFIDTDRTGPLAGRTILSIGGYLPGEGPPDILIVDYVKPLPGGFQLDVPITFDPDPHASPYIAASYILGDIDVTTVTVGRIYYADSGSVMVSEVGETSGARIRGTVSQTTYREIDDQGADVLNGCAAWIGGLTFDAYHNGMNLAPPTGSGEVRPLSRAEWAAVDAIRALHRR
jgi:hypothetical protein